MFYAQLILGKKGALGKVWLAVHSEKKLNRDIIFSTDVTKSADRIANHKGDAMPLRVSGSLLLGVVRIYSHKVRYLSTDCDEALSKIKVAFRPGAASNVDSLGAASASTSTSSIVVSAGAAAGGATAGTPDQQLKFQREGLMTRNGKEVDGGVGRGVGMPFCREPFPLFSLSQRLTLEGSLPPLAEEWMEAAAMTLARKQDIRMPEGEEEGGRKGGREGGRGALEKEEEKELVLGRRLSEEEMEVQQEGEERREEGMRGEGGEEGWVGRPSESQRSSADGREGGREGEEWEAFDPLKVGVEEFDPSSASAAAAAAAAAAAGRKRRFEDMKDEEGRMEGGNAVDGDGDYLNYHDNGTGMIFFDDEVEGGGNADEDEEREDEGLAVEVGRGGGGKSLMGGEDNSPLLELVCTGGEDNLPLLELVCTESPEGGREGGKEGGLLSPMAEGTPDHDLPPFLGGQMQVEEEVGREDEMGVEYDIAEEREIRFSFSSSISLISRRRGSRESSLGGGGGGGQGGRKRRLPKEKALMLTGAEMKSQLTDRSDLVLPRVRPRDRVRKERGKGGGKQAGVEGRMQAHVLVGELREELEGVVKEMMKPVQDFRLPVAVRRGMGGEGGLGPGRGMRCGVNGGRKRRREEEEEGGREEEEEAIDEGAGYEDDFHIDNDEDYHYQGPTGQGEVMEEDDLCHQHHDREEEDEDEDDGGFIRTNDVGTAVAADDDDVFGEKASTQWHPNTVRLCKLLRARVAAAERKQQHGQEREQEGGGEGGEGLLLSQITRNARRTEAANLFWEVLQLKTWDIIECAQETAYGEVVIKPAARFHEPILGEA